MNSLSHELSLLKKDYVFPHDIPETLSRLSDFEDLEIQSFTTSDKVTLRYWAAGSGKPLIFLPGWSGNGTHFTYVMYLLRHHYRVYALDYRNHGLSDPADYGNRISRFTMDVKEFTEHLGIESAYFAGHSMGSAILWNFIDLFGTSAILKAAFIDQPPSILSRADMNTQERLEAGAMCDTADELIESLTSHEPSMMTFAPNTAYSENVSHLSSQLIPTNHELMSKVLYDHASNDWRDVISKKIDIPTAIFTGEYSPNLPSQRWINSVVPHSDLYVYTKAEHGDHLLIAKNPVKFAKDLNSFLLKEGETK